MFNEEIATIITAWSTVVVALATVFLALLTALLFLENRQLRKAGFAPKIVAYIRPDIEEVNLLYLFVSNVGKGPAFEVCIKFPNDEKAFDGHDVKLKAFKGNVPLNVMPQQDTIKFFLGVGWQLFQEPRLKPFICEIQYRDIIGRKITTRTAIDISSFDGYTQANNSSQSEIAKNTKSIKEEIARTRTSVERISSNILRVIEADEKSESL